MACAHTSDLGRTVTYGRNEKGVVEQMHVVTGINPKGEVFEKAHLDRDRPY